MSASSRRPVGTASWLASQSTTMPQLFDACGESIPPGGPALETLNLRQWPGCHMIFSTSPAVIGLWVVFSDGRPDVQADVIARAVACLELGQSVVVHAPDDAAAELVAAKIGYPREGVHPLPISRGTLQ
jgi:hypothetical protein